MIFGLDIKTGLEEQVQRYDSIGHPATMERFVLRNGREGISRPRPKGVRKGQDKQCFSNSANWVLGKKGKGWTYTEGYALRPSLGLLIHHAWVTNAEGHVLDLTWRDPEQCLYFGVPFTEEELRQELVKNEVYGLLVPFDMYNTDLMFRKDPGLQEMVERVIEARKQVRQAAAG